MRQQPPTETAIGNGQLSSHIAWQPGEINFTETRFALSHATGQGQAVLNLHAPRPHLRAALAIESLNLDPFLPAAAPAAAQPPAPAGPPAESAQVFYEMPTGAETKLEAQPLQMAQAQPAEAEPAQASQAPTEAKSDDTPVIVPAAFDADFNVNINQTTWSRVVVGPSSLSLSLRDGVLDATLGSMQLYDGAGQR